MDTLLVAGTAVAGLFIGGALDPIGQRLAERSRIDDERRRAQRQEAVEGQGAGDDGLAPAVDRTGGATGQSQTPAEQEAAADAEAADRTVRNLVPAGRAPVRTLVAAACTSALLGAAAAHFGRDLILAPFCVFLAMLVVVAVTDLSHRLVPRRIVYSAMALIVPLLVVAAAVDHRWHSLTGSVIAGAVAFGFFFAIWWFIPRGMGFGDVRLAGAIGLTVGYLSLLHAYVAFLAGFVAGMLFGLVMMVVSASGRKTRIPFAPSLAAGAVIGLFWGGHVAHSLFPVGT
ncbi:MAG: prepilin peptidase [Acidimicrobiales bacterium]|nr:prepilin peptidase [Acidimicrobiales bacterium]